MEPKMFDKPAFTVVGVTAAGQPGSLNYSQIWEKQYMPFDETLKPYSIDGGYYGVTLMEDGQTVYLAGMAVSGLPQLPTGAELRSIPAAHYAVFECGMNDIGDTWRTAYEQWLPTSSYTLGTGAADFEYYPPHSGEGEMRIEICIPVKQKLPIPQSQT